MVESANLSELDRKISPADTVKETPIARDRSDLVKRLFAVCLSVGFANQIINMVWLTNGKLPPSNEVPDLLLLIVSLIIIVLSWDGYLRVLQEFPLEDVYRFFLDIGIVFSYLILLQCAHTRTDLAWVYIIDVIFCTLSYLGLSHNTPVSRAKRI
jgi:hypothetical protein